MYGLVICFLLMPFGSFAQPFTDIPVNVTDTVTKLHDECFKIFLHITVFLHGNLDIMEIPSEMHKTASFCFNKYAHLCQQGTLDGYISTQQDTASSFQEDIIYDSVKGWRDFTNGSLTYQEIHCIIHVITKMMNHSQVNLCSVLSTCSAALNGTQCEVTYTGLLMTLQENCHCSSQDCDCKMVYTHTNTCIVSMVAAVLCSIAALLAGGAYVHFKYFKKGYQCNKCRAHPQPHCSLPLSAPQVNVPVRQPICTFSGSHHNRRIMSSATGEVHHEVQHHNCRQEFESESLELASFLNQHEEYNCAEIPDDSDYETCNFRESLYEQHNQNIVEYMEISNSSIPEYLEILPDCDDLEISADHANEDQLGFNDLQHKYTKVGEIVRPIRTNTQAAPSEKQVIMANEINLKNVVTKEKNSEESCRLDKSSLLGRWLFMQEIQNAEHVQNMESRLSLTDDLVEIVIDNANRQLSENGASVANDLRTLETSREHFPNAATFRHSTNSIHNSESTTQISGRQQFFFPRK